jgi:hypothetical protein
MEQHVFELSFTIEGATEKGMQISHTKAKTQAAAISLAVLHLLSENHLTNRHMVDTNTVKGNLSI